jgi:branched-chain amino acid transport system ATP-binding protein|tara:strand:- start:185 stop:889 length:705 start_codon:yes stop_codon:yes gene_type:complete
MPKKVLETKNLNAFYGDFQALFDVSIDLFEGEIISIIGANGAGKSTFMRSVAGLIDKIDNDINFNGSSIKNLRADEIAQKGIAMVPEGRKLFPSLSVEENLLIGSQTKRSGPWKLSSVYELFPDLCDKKNIPSNLLSGGQQQMAAIGRALMSNPEVILFDEISLGLAPIIIKNIYQNLPLVIQDGMSAVVVEQDINKAIEISDRVYCLQEGRIALTGESKKLTREEISKAYFGI